MARKKVREKIVPDVDAGSTDEQSGLGSRSKSLVFISHDSRDADLAEAFSNLLSDVSAGMLKSFRSSDKKGTSGIEFGAEWYAAIMSQLSDATAVVALLTAGSVDRPWILYEAGVAKGKLETTVFGIALGVPLEKVSTGPFGQFQNCSDDEDSLTKLVMQLLRRNPDAEPREEAVRRQVQIFRQNEDKLLKAKGKTELPSSSGEEQNIAKLFEEVKAMVRELPERIDDSRVEARPEPFQRSRRFHPMMIEKLIRRGLEQAPAEAAAFWILTISLIRDDVPWLYEPGLELYRALQSGDVRAIKRARDQIGILLDITARNRMYREFVAGDEESYFIVRRLAKVIYGFLSHIHAGEVPRRRLALKSRPEEDVAD